MSREYIKRKILQNLLEEISGKYDRLFKVKQKLLEEVHYKASYDMLTSLYNRYKFLELASHELNCVKAQTSMGLSLAFIDLDNFKFINDTYGHEEGDKTLRFISKTIREKTNFEEFVLSRFGGDEFLILRKNSTDEKGFLRILEDIKEVLKRHNISISVGITTVDTKQSQNFDIDNIIALADQKMYRSKSSGKGKIIV